MKSNAGCCRRPLAVLVIGASWLIGCAVADSDAPPSACPAVVEYSRAEQARVADEMAGLPEGGVITEWLADYAVLRAQARACQTT